VRVNSVTMLFADCFKKSIIIHMIDTQYFKDKLEAEKKVLEQELGEIGTKDITTGDWEAVPPLLDNNDVSDENDTADRAEEYEERTSILNTLELRLKDINDALFKIQNGAYGICEVSGAEIEHERLEANPAARTCIAHMN
jgi:RNA polymerase-binding transcription factor DksA